MRILPALALCCLAGCPAPVPVSPLAPPRGRSAAALPSALEETERARLLGQDLAALFGAEPQAHQRALARLQQRSRDGERAARTALLVFAVRDALRDGCGSPAERQAFLQQVDTLESHLKATDARLSEWAVAGPAFLLGLQAAGRIQDLLEYAPRVQDAAAALWTEQPLMRGEVLFDTAHALRQGCHLKTALPLLEKTVALLGGGPQGARHIPALLARRDLATLRYLLGDAQGAQRDLAALATDLPAGEEDEAAARREVVATLQGHLIDERGQPGPAPRETGPGWQALRTVQQEASCPEATPADPRFVRVPVPPPACSLAAR